MSDTNRKVVLWLASIVCFIALSVLVGWCFNVTSFLSIMPAMTTMNPVVAVTFVIVTMWFFISCRTRETAMCRILKRTIPVIVLLVGVLKVLQYWGAIDVGVDMWLFPGKLTTRMLNNAMAPTTAFLFVCLAINLLIPNRSSRRRMVNDAILLGSFLVSYLGVIGYVYTLEPFYKIGSFVPMALPTAICFTIVQIAVFITPPYGNLARVFFSKYLGGKLVRRAIPMILFIPAVFGYTHLMLERAKFYDVEYGITLDTAFLVLAVLLAVFYYGYQLNMNDRERKRGERAILQSEEKYRSLVYALKEGVIYFDKDRKIVFYNPSFSAMTGYGQRELIGKSIFDTLIPKDYIAGTGEEVDTWMQPMPEDYESQILHKDGTKILVHITARPILKDGQPDSYLSTIIDITERKRREEDIEAFSSSAAHDLNAPLIRVEMMVNFILDMSRDHLTAEDLEYLNIILKTTVDMRQLLKDLLLFARIGIEKMEKVHIDMNKMVNEIISSIANTACIQIDDLPMGYGEPSALKQVWTNLIGNAVKYSSKKEKPEVRIGSEPQQGKTVYYIKDNGAGFDMAHAAGLFAPFKRLHADFEGNGLGLPIVKRIIEKHNGKIWAESEKDKGATFYFSL